MPQNSVKPPWAKMPLALVLLLSGCAAPSVSPPVAIQCPAPPPIPALSQPLPAQSYSLSVQQSIKRWESELMATPPMSKP